MTRSTPAELLGYLAAPDVDRPEVFGRSLVESGMAPFYSQPHSREPGVYWITDLDAAHRGHKAVERWRDQGSYGIPTHTGVDAIGLHPVEIDLLIEPSKALRPPDFFL